MICKNKFFLYSLSLLSMNAYSLDCLYNTIDELYENSDYIYVGTIISSDKIFTFSDFNIENDVEITEVLKGEPDSHFVYSVSENIKKKSSNDYNLYSQRLYVGNEYIVYGKYNEKVYNKVCSSNVNLLDSDDVLYIKKNL